MASMLSRNLSATSALDLGAEKAEEDARFKLLGKLQRNFAMILTTGTKLSEPEEVVRLTQADLSRLETLAAKRAAREKKINDVFEINVVCVRTVVERGRVRSRAHEVRRPYCTSCLKNERYKIGIYYPDKKDRIPRCIRLETIW